MIVCSPVLIHSFTLIKLPLAGDIVFTNASGELFVYNLGDIAWMLAATALVWIMTPGIGFFYSGLLRRKNALSMIWASMVVMAVVTFQVRPCILNQLATLIASCSGFSGGTFLYLQSTR